MRIYTIFDEVAQEAGPLFEAPNDGVAMRNFRSVLKQLDPLDAASYRLLCLGTRQLSANLVLIPFAVPEVVEAPALSEGADA